MVVGKRTYKPRRPYGSRGPYRVKSRTTPAKKFRGRMRIKPRMKFGPKRILVKNQNQAVSYDHNFNTISRVSKIVKQRYAAGALNVYKWEEANSFGISPGKQGVFLYNVMTVPQMTQVLTYVGLTPSAIAGSILNTSRSFWSKCVEETRMTNSSNGNLEVQLYLFNTKRDTYTDVSTLWRDGLYDELGSTLVDYRGNQGVTPFDAKAVGIFYNCYKIIRIMLAPGQSHIHRSTFHFNKTMNNELLSKSNELALKGFTKPLLIVANGLPVTAIAGTSVSSATANLDVIRCSTYEFKFIQDENTNFQYYTQNAISATAGSLYNQGSGVSATSSAI